MTRVPKAPAVAIAAVGAALALQAADYNAFRVMSFNICHCATNNTLSVTDNEIRRLASVVAAQGPDFVCLQEVDKETTRSNGIDEAARIAELLGEATGDQWHAIFGKGRDYRDGEFGVAILSKAAPRSVSLTPFEGTEPRALLVCEFDDFFMATVHLDLNRNYRTNSIHVIRETLAALPKPVFLTGDWNATPATDATIPMMREFLTVVSPTNGVSTFTPRDGTDYVIDYIAVDSGSAGRFLVRRAWCVPNRAADGVNSSDHNPVLVDIVARPGAGSLAWVEENAVAAGMTGAWSREVAYDAGALTAEILGDSSFTPLTPSRGNVVTNFVTATFGKAWGMGDPGDGVQTAVRLGTNGCFQVWAGGGGGPPAWIDVEADGLAPVDGAQYTVRVVIDYRAQTFAAGIASEAASFIPLRALDHGAEFFPLASAGRRVSRIDFAGETAFTSLFGDFADRSEDRTMMMAR